MNYQQQVNEYVANLGIWNFKLHNLHWNVKGIAFKSVHEFFESVYDEAFEFYDAVAELLKIQGADPVVKASDYLQLASIQEIDGKDFSIEEAITILEDDIKHMSNLAKQIREAADKDDNFALANMMEDHIAYYEKQLWFIRATLNK